MPNFLPVQGAGNRHGVIGASNKIKDESHKEGIDIKYTNNLQEEE
jgi:hypothetical protein